MQAWDQLSPEEKKLYARFEEVYAGYLSYADYEVARLINHLKLLHILNNTLIFVMIGDNGASKEGTLNGDVDRPLFSSGLPPEENIQYNLARIGEIGTPQATQGNYPLGWAQAMDTPFKDWKLDADAEGGSHNPLIVYWPKGIRDKGGIRTQYAHVIDVLPTTLDLAGVKDPAAIKGVKQIPIEGTSFAYSLNDARAPSRHTVQYYYSVCGTTEVVP